MEDAENQPSKANHSVGYSLEFHPEKPKTFAPKCVLEYYAKPALSFDQLQQKLDRAAMRRKVWEACAAVFVHRYSLRVCT